jgi:hypothetical protein
MSKKTNEVSNGSSNLSSWGVTPEEKIENLKSNLKGGSYEEKFINLFIKENQNISALIDNQNNNETDLKQNTENTNNFNDEIFEEKVLQIFTSSFDVDALNIYRWKYFINLWKWIWRNYRNLLW